MSISKSHLEGDPVDALAEEFAARLRRNEAPTIEEYTQRYPQWAERIRQVFAALLANKNFLNFQIIMASFIPKVNKKFAQKFVF